MSSTKLLACVIISFIPAFGHSLKCYSYTCMNRTNGASPSCAPPQEVTCEAESEVPVPHRCITRRLMIRTFGMVEHQETRNCSNSFECNMVDAICKMINKTVNKKLEKCQIGCCQGDLCNSGGPIPTRAPGPPGPSGADLSCYSCSNKPQSPDCKNPVMKTCGTSHTTQLTQDRCITMKLKFNTPSGTIEEEMKNCSDAIYCNEDTFCKLANNSGKLSDCQVSCCFGNLCNSDAMPATATASVEPKPTQSPTYKGAGANVTTAKGGAGPSATEIVRAGDASTKTRMLAALIFISFLFGKMFVYNFSG